MPHRCVNCGEVLTELNDDLIRKGCPNCGCKLFERIPEDDDPDPATIVVERDGVYRININNIDDVVTVYKSGKYFILFPSADERGRER